MARKFKPDYKYKPGQFIVLNINPPVSMYDGLTLPVPPPIVLKIIHINIYNRKNIKYICKEMDGSILPIDTDYADKYSITGRPGVLKVLYGNSKVR